ncbi:helix-turn-helix transcriptional regulator [uncultured Tateyamaria sp.]
MSLLSDFLKTQVRSQFAERVGISGAYLSQLSSGLRTPSLEVASAIERETGGAVPMQSWGKEHSSCSPSSIACLSEAS